MFRYLRRRPLAVIAASVIALLYLSIEVCTTSAQEISEKHPSKVADIVVQMCLKCQEADAVGVTDLSDISNELGKVTPEGDIELTFHAVNSTGLTEETDLEYLGAKIVDRLVIPEELGLPPAGMIQAWMPYEQIEAAASLPWVTAVTLPAYGDVDPHPTNPFNSEGVALHNSGLAQNMGINGAGVSIGAISDGVSNLVASQNGNELPAVNVLNAGAGDEGTAMLEIIHDMAPGAALLYNATGGGVVTHTNRMNALVAAGANVIAEDIAFDSQPAFQQGIAAATADAIAAGGVSVHSSAGNRGQNHAARVQAIGTGAGPDGVAGPFAGCTVQPTNTVAIAPGGDTTFDVTLGNRAGSVTLQWSEPRAIFPTAGQGGFTNLDLYIMNQALTQCLFESSGGQGNGVGDTIERVAFGAGFGGTQVKIVVNVTGTLGAAAVPILDLRWRGAAPVDAPTRAGSLNPDSNYTGLATSAAAVNANSGAIEGFSSGGPVQLGLTTLWNGAGNPGLAGPGLTNTPGPTWAAADGVSISGAGGFGSASPVCPAVNQGDCLFFGTSASAPHAAACDALVRQVIGIASAVLPVNTRLASTATDINPAGPDNITGAGLLNCLLAVGPPDADAGPDQDAEWVIGGAQVTLDGTGSSDPNGDPITFTWTGGFNEGGGTVMGSSPNVTFPSLGTFVVQLTVTDSFGLSDSDTVTITVEDTTDPVISCNNALGTIIPPDAPISFTATATDTCDPNPTVEIIDFDCFKFTKKGKRIDKTESCEVLVDGDTITILDSGGVGDHITWTVQATDASANQATLPCEVVVVNPAQ